MRKTLLPVIIATLSTFILLSCGKEDGMLANPEGSINPNPGGNNVNANAKKCYVSEIKTSQDDPNEEESIVRFTYNAKNLLKAEKKTEKKCLFNMMPITVLLRCLLLLPPPLIVRKQLRINMIVREICQK